MASCIGSGGAALGVPYSTVCSSRASAAPIHSPYLSASRFSDSAGGRVTPWPRHLRANAAVSSPTAIGASLFKFCGCPVRRGGRGDLVPQRVQRYVKRRERCSGGERCARPRARPRTASPSPSRFRPPTAVSLAAIRRSRTSRLLALLRAESARPSAQSSSVSRRRRSPAPPVHSSRPSAAPSRFRFGSSPRWFRAASATVTAASS